MFRFGVTVRVIIMVGTIFSFNAHISVRLLKTFWIRIGLGLGLGLVVGLRLLFGVGLR